MPVSEDHVKYAKNISFVIGANVAIFFLGFIRLPILTNWLGGSLYGTWAIVLVTVSLVSPVALMGLASAIVHFLAADTDKAKIREDYYSIALAILAMGTFLSLLMFASADVVASTIFKDIDSAYYLRLGSFLILMQSLVGITLAYFRTFQQMVKYSILTLLTRCSQLALMAGLLWLGWGLEGVIIAVLVSDVLFVFVSLFIIVRQVGFRIPRFSNLRRYIAYGLPLVPNVALFWIISASDRYMIGYFIGAQQVGIYSAAYTLSNQITFFVTPITTVLFPTISKLYNEGKIEETKTYLKYSLKYVMMITIPSAFGLSVLAGPLLKIFTTPEFIPGALVVPLVTGGLVFLCFRQITTFVLYLVNKTGWVGSMLAIGAVSNIVLNLILIPRWGIIGAAAATLVAYVILGTLSLVVSFHYMKFDIELTFMVKSIVSSSVMAIAIWLLNPYGITMTLIAIVSGALVYFALLFAMRGFSRGEFSLLKRLLLSFKPPGPSLRNNQ